MIFELGPFAWVLPFGGWLDNLVLPFWGDFISTKLGPHYSRPYFHLFSRLRKLNPRFAVKEVQCHCRSDVQDASSSFPMEGRLWAKTAWKNAGERQGKGRKKNICIFWGVPDHSNKNTTATNTAQCITIRPGHRNNVN